MQHAQYPTGWNTCPVPGTGECAQNLETSLGGNAKNSGSAWLLHTVGPASAYFCCTKKICHFLTFSLPACGWHARGNLHRLRSSKEWTKLKVKPCTAARHAWGEWEVFLREDWAVAYKKPSLKLFSLIIASTEAKHYVTQKRSDLQLDLKIKFVCSEEKNGTLVYQLLGENEIPRDQGILVPGMSSHHYQCFLHIQVSGRLNESTRASLVEELL